MLQLLKEHRGFYIPFFLFLVSGALLLSFYDKSSLHVFINSFHSAPSDLLIPYLTWLGDGWFISAICLISLFIKFRIAILLILSNALSSGITYFLKYQIYPDMDRPLEYFKQNVSLHWVEGLDIHSHYSFPSGHATIAFATGVLMASFVSSQTGKVFLFMLALFAAYTRVYLSQHFFNDIFAGAAIGTITATLLLAAMTFYRKGNNREWLEHSLLKK